MLSTVRIIFIMTFFLFNCAAFSYPELRLLNVVFRHGNRCPTSDVLGDITTEGKQRAYHLGEVLRVKYRDFLGDIYEPATLVSQSTEYMRAKLSLQLLLAALYVPRKHQQWHESLVWQPIPYSYSPYDNDMLLSPRDCPRFIQEYDKMESSEEFQKLLDPYRELMKNLTIASNVEVKTAHDCFILYHNLIALESMNESLPEWTNGIYPDGPLKELSFLEYKLQKFNDWMNKVNGGTLLRKIIDDMLYKIDHNKTDRHKVFLYSTHELIVVALLESLKVWKLYNIGIPDYSSAIIIELREHPKNYYVKVIYYDGISKFKEMQLPGCPNLCPIEKFIDIVSDQLPVQSAINCDVESVKIQ